MIIKVKKLHADAVLPRFANESAVGADLSAYLNEEDSEWTGFRRVIEPGQILAVPTGIAVELPESLELQIRPRSGLAARNGITVLNAPGTIDPDYRGEISVLLVNHGKHTFIIEHGMRIAQAVPAFRVSGMPSGLAFVEQDYLSETIRGEKGFGSTGLKELIQ